MASRKVPTQSQSLFPLDHAPTRGFRAFIVTRDKPAEVFGLTEGATEEGKTVSGFVQGAPGQEFEVGLYYGLQRKVPKSVDVEIWFGQEKCTAEFVKPSKISHDGALDDENRFVMFSSHRVDAGHIRKFSFAKIPTTSESGAACYDEAFLDNVSAINIKFRQIRNVRRDREREQEEQKTKAKRDDPLKRVEQKLLDERTDSTM
ncbi:hypothetical protein JCM10213_007683 [Rhodosporidiobolus nylandii]